MTGDDIYGGTSRLLAQVVPKVGIEVVNVDMKDHEAVRGGDGKGNDERSRRGCDFADEQTSR